MYQLLLTRRYLTSKVMPLLAAVAVVLCTTTELVVWSVMGGFLNMLLDTGRTMVGDVSIQWPIAGFGHYGDLIARLEADDRVAAAAPMLETYGQLLLPGGQVRIVGIKGVEGESFSRVTGYHDTLWWRPIDEPLKRDREGLDPRLDPRYAARMRERLERGERLHAPMPGGEVAPAVVPGIEVSGLNRRRAGGWYEPMDEIRRTADGGISYVRSLFHGGPVTLSVLAMDRAGRMIEPVAREFPVANEFYSGLYQADSGVVLVELSALQRMLRMHEGRRVGEGGAGALEVRVDPETGEEAFVLPEAERVDPARVTTVLVRAAGVVSADELAAVCREVYAEFAAAHEGVPDEHSIQVSTWRQQNAMLIAAVEKEIVLVMFIFGIVSITVIFLVLAIFWAMVSEKTRDIGTLRAMGAGGFGIAGLWLCYGLAIGLVGSALGVLAAYGIVTYINPIHDGLIGIGRVFDQDWAVWNPEVYYFSEIPNEVQAWKAGVIFTGGVVASVLGALIPAVRAARMDPVRSLRFD